MKSLHRRLLNGCILLAIVFHGISDTGAEEPIAFNRGIRPILSNHCFTCYSFDEANRMGGLRLDVRESAIAESDSAIAIVPGDPDASDLVRRITSEDDGVVMPPIDGGKRLSRKEVSLLRAWGEQGAEYQQHWSLIAPTQTPLPATKGREWYRNEIDNFVLARLEKAGLQPSSEADLATMLRRVSLDLTGLPPTLAEQDACLSDEHPDAYERAVDRLMKSKRFGEHRARYWLDGARYGDTHGMARDNERSIWPYRDWVIQAFNDNMPFDRFTVSQIAGDLLPNATVADRVATGFMRCIVSTGEGGSIDEELIATYASDRVATTSTVWMGLTVACAACHDHKFDPISQKEYYQLLAFFNNLKEEPMNGNALDPSPVIAVPNARQASALENLDRREAELNQQHAAQLSQHLNADFDRWLNGTGNLSAHAIARMLRRDERPTSPWFASKIFREENNTTVYFDDVLGPENGEGLQDEAYQWKAKPIWNSAPGRISGDNGAIFYRRDIEATWPHTVTLNLSSNDKLWKSIRWKVWLNGELVFSRHVRQADVPCSFDLPIPLDAGKNRILIRASHFGGPLRGRFELKDRFACASQRELQNRALTAMTNRSEGRHATTF